MLVRVCENHPRRTIVMTFRYYDGHGIRHVDLHYCPECRERVTEDEPRWRPVDDPDELLIYEWRQPRCQGECGAGPEYHASLEPVAV